MRTGTIGISESFAVSTCHASGARSIGGTHHHVSTTDLQPVQADRSARMHALISRTGRRPADLQATHCKGGVSPEPTGQVIVTRHHLKSLLDRLEALD